MRCQLLRRSCVRPRGARRAVLRQGEREAAGAGRGEIEAGLTATQELDIDRRQQPAINIGAVLLANC